MTPEKLCELASQAMHHAYAPYSGFKVGAALLCKDGTVYQGCNIENAAYGPTNCGERTAIFKAVYDGQRDFVAIAVTGAIKGEKGNFCAPCGICRQFLAEFCSEQTDVILGDDKKYSVYKLSELLPCGFSLPD